jgi:hypothetical protein
LPSSAQGPDPTGGRFARLALILAIVLLAATAISIQAVRSSVLRTVGWALVAEDPVGQADVIVIPASESDAGILEAADLVRGGSATRVAIFDDPPDDVEREFIRRGVAYEDPASVALRRLGSLGIENVERIPKSLAGTEEEARVLPAWCRTRQLHSVIVISTADHSRRVRRVFNRAVERGDVKITVRVARHSEFRPDRWWQTRDGTRTAIVELQKLLLDLALHPIS